MFEHVITLSRVAVVAADQGEQPVAVGAAGIIGDSREIGEGLLGLLPRRIKLAVQPFCLAAYAGDAGGEAPGFRTACGKLPEGFVGKGQSARRVALAQVPCEADGSFRALAPGQ
jgi:hypothetical protein